MTQSPIHHQNLFKVGAMVVKLACQQDQMVFTKFFTATIELMAIKWPILLIIKLVGVTLFGIAIVMII